MNLTSKRKKSLWKTNFLNHSQQTQGSLQVKSVHWNKGKDLNCFSQYNLTLSSLQFLMGTVALVPGDGDGRRGA